MTVSEKGRKVFEALREAELHALVAVSLENVLYTSDVLIMTQRHIPSRLALTVLFPDESATMIVCTIEEQQVREESWIDEVRGYVEFRQSPVALLAELLREKGLAGKRIGIEERCLSAAAYRELHSLLPEGELVAGDAVFDRARMTKTREEIEVLSRAATGTDGAIRDAFTHARVGRKESDVVATLTGSLLRRGADGLSFVVLATGRNSLLAHPTPSAVEIQEGDVVRTDSGGYYGSYYAGYYSDLARTAVARRPTQQHRDVYARLFEVHDLLIRSAKPGVRACDLYSLCRDAFAQRGLNFTAPHVGHSIGLNVHEHPMLNPFVTEPLRTGMVLAIEPIHREPDGIFHVEDMLEITEAGARLLSPGYEWSDLFVIA